MRTEDLIARLAADPAPDRPSIESGVTLALAVGLAAAVAFYSWCLGPRPELLAALMQPITVAKTLIPLGIGLFALGASLRVARPGLGAGGYAFALLAMPVIAAALLFWAFQATAPSQRLAVFLGHSIQVCLPSVTLMALPLFAGLAIALRRGAPTHPGRAGALAGLVAGGFAAAVYSTFCTEDSPLFYVVWYGSGILIATLIGAVVGRWALRW